MTIHPFWLHGIALLALFQQLTGGTVRFTFQVVVG